MERTTPRVTSDAFHILDMENGQQKVSGFKEPSIPVNDLSTKQIQATTTEKHSAQERHRLLTALKVVRFEDDEEFEDVK
jgi:hypothetical protein